MAKAQIEEQVQKELAKIYLPPAVIECGKQFLRKRLQTENATQSNIAGNIGKSIAQQKQRILQMEDNFCIESDQEARDLMKRKLREAKIELCKLEEDYEKEHTAPKVHLETVQNELNIIEGVSEKFQNGDKEERQKIIRSLGSNWKIKSRKLVYKPNFLPSAIQEAKNSLPPDFPRLEPPEDRSKNKKLTSREASLVWRREWDSNPRSLAGRRFSRPFHSTALASLRKHSLQYAKKNFLAIFMIS